MRAVPRGTRTAVWFCVLLAAFVTTHLPPAEPPAQPFVNDKALHFAGFALLGILTIWRIADERHPIAFRVLSLWFLGLTAYGLLDERTQPLVGRTFEWMDWAADICGAALGIAIGVACHHRTLTAKD